MQAFLGLGSNMGNRSEILNEAVKKINEQIGEVISLSAFYDTAPEGFDSRNRFLNAVCCVETNLLPLAVQEKTEKIEKTLGRKTKSVNRVYSDRPIDIDILLMDNEIVDSEKLKVPHPYMHERMFVLKPLLEIAPDVWHPVLKKTVKDLYNELTGSQHL